MRETKYHLVKVVPIQTIHGTVEERYTLCGDNGDPIEFDSERDARAMASSMEEGVYLIKHLVREVKETKEEEEKDENRNESENN